MTTLTTPLQVNLSLMLGSNWISTFSIHQTNPDCKLNELSNVDCFPHMVIRIGLSHVGNHQDGRDTMRKDGNEHDYAKKNSRK